MENGSGGFHMKVELANRDWTDYSSFRKCEAVFDKD